LYLYQIFIFLLGHLHFFLHVDAEPFSETPYISSYEREIEIFFQKKVLVCMHRPSKKEIMPDVYTAKSVARD